MELKSKISIIVPIYNAELYLSRCLDSLINQTYKNIEVICVNDGSTDRSLEIAMTYSRQHSEIIVVNKCNTGVSDSRNVALQRATGDYVMFVDSDDWISPNMVKHLLKEAVTSNAELVMCGYSSEYKDRTKDKIFDLPDRVVYENDDLNQLHRQLFGPLNHELGNPESLDAIGTVWGKLYDMSILRKYDLKFVDLKIIGSNEDGLFNVEVFEYLTKVVFINQSLYHYWKENSSSITSKYNSQLPLQWKQLFEYLKHHIEIYQKGSDYEEALKNRRCISLLGLGLNECFSGRKTSYMKKVSRWKQILKDSEVQEDYQNFNIGAFPIHWRLFYYFNKKRMATLSFTMVMIIDFLRKRV